MAHIKDQLEEVGLTSESAAELKAQFEKLSESKGVEGISILQRLYGGEKSARGAINDMFGTEYLDSKLGVQSREPVIKQAGGRYAALPRTEDLAEEPIRQQLKRDLLADVEAVIAEGGRLDARRHPLTAEFVQSLGEVVGYAERAQGTKQSEYDKVLDELGDTAGGSTRTAQAFNKLLDLKAARLNDRVDRIVRDAAARGDRTTQEVQDMGAKARAAADAEIARLQARRLPIPTADFSASPAPGGGVDVSVDLHPEGRGGVITPGDPRWQEPRSSDIPRPGGS
jgi:hypothetical protein